MLRGRKKESLERDIKGFAGLDLKLWARNVVGDNFFVVGQCNPLKNKSRSGSIPESTSVFQHDKTIDTQEEVLVSYLGRFSCAPDIKAAKLLLFLRDILTKFVQFLDGT